MKVEKLVERLFETDHGGKAFDAADKLIKQMNKGSEDAQVGLIRYLEQGQFDHVREHIAAVLAEDAAPGNEQLAEVFRGGLQQPATAYWSVLGLINTLGPASYEELVAVAMDESQELDVRAHAVKRLAVDSQQTFDRGLDEDPGSWPVESLRLDEVQAWAASGYGAGEGYAEPRPTERPALPPPSGQKQGNLGCLHPVI